MIGTWPMRELAWYMTKNNMVRSDCVERNYILCLQRIKLTVVHVEHVLTPIEEISARNQMGHRGPWHLAMRTDMIVLRRYHQLKGRHHAEGIQVPVRRLPGVQDGALPCRLAEADRRGQGAAEDRHRERYLRLLIYRRLTNRRPSRREPRRRGGCLPVFTGGEYSGKEK